MKKSAVVLSIVSILALSIFVSAESSNFTFSISEPNATTYVLSPGELFALQYEDSNATHSFLSLSQIQELQSRVNEVHIDNYTDLAFYESNNTFSGKFSKTSAVFPDYFKQFDYDSKGKLVNYEICNSNRWDAVFRGDYVTRTNLNKFWDIISRWFGRGFCTTTVGNKSFYITPKGLLGEFGKENFNVTFERVSLNGQNVLKVTEEHVLNGGKPENYRVYYYDNKSLLLVASTNVNADKTVPSKGILLHNVSINTNMGVFDIYIPNGASLCELDLRKANDLDKEIRSMSSVNSAATLTEAQFNQVNKLRAEEALAQCSPLPEDIRYNETYQQYTGQIFPECENLTTDEECIVKLMDEGKVNVTFLKVPNIEGTSSTVILLENNKTGGECAGLTAEKCILYESYLRFAGGVSGYMYEMSFNFSNPNYQFYRFPAYYSTSDPRFVPPENANYNPPSGGNSSGGSVTA